MQYLATSVVVALLLGSAYVGFSNADDVLNTVTVWQRLVGIMATAYGIAALVALYGLWRRRHWLSLCLQIWAVLIVVTVALAAVVYGQTWWSTILTALVAAIIVAPAVVYGRRHQHDVSAPRTPAT